MAKKKKKKNEWIDWVKALLIAVLVAFVVRMFLFAPIVVDGPSMLPNLHDRNQIIVNKVVYRLHEPERFDVVVFHASEKKDFIKRVVGLPGEHIEMENDTLYVDGEAVDEPYLDEEKSELGDSPAPLTDDFTLEDLPGEYDVIPDGHVLVLGDNRKNSTDSRRLGVIPIDSIVGKASFVYWPLNDLEWLNIKE
ncbi:MAG TPA: signal peptidase I [Virgibacillus sp.]|nr:signal peptidase I [Virgibacillus sp.]